jgi:YegS/Rv2252/BmrU family lipid kinase
MLIVLNPAAGQRHRRRLDTSLAALTARGVPFDLRETRRAGDATEIARAAARSGASLVIAAGGDGTVAEVVNGLLAEPAGARGCALGILALGTANVLAHELAIPVSATDFAGLVARRHTRPMDPGVLAQGDSSRWFVQMVGAGFDAEVVRRVSMRLKRKVGGAAYAWQGLVEAARYGFPSIEVVIDGVPTRTHGVIVTKGRLYGGRYTLAPGASPLKPGFNVVLLDRPGALAALACGMALPFGKMAKMPGVRLLPARHVRVDGAAPIQADGDSWGVGPFEIRPSPRPLDVLMH